MAYFFMMVGIPASGKTTYGGKLAEASDAILLSSDKIREELYGDESILGSTSEVFSLLKSRTLEYLKQGKSVVYDATNLHSSNKTHGRQNFLSRVSEIPSVRKVCIVMVERPSDCQKRQLLRERKVPDSLIWDMHHRLQYPTYEEGWDEIYLIRHMGNDSSLLSGGLDGMSLLDYILYHKNWREELQNPPFCLDIRQKGDLYLFKYQQLNSDFHYTVVRESRGCILEIKEGIPEYVCRPFTKFFNVQEELAARIDWSTARVTEKIDGSLMKMFYYDGHWNLATNGTINAFEAEVSDTLYTFGQIFERVLGESVYSFGDKYLDKDYTYLFELTSPETRVVIPYSDGIYFLTSKRNSDGFEESRAPIFSGRISYPKVYNLHKIEDVLQVVSMMTKDEEGVVVSDAEGERVKVKNTLYLDAARFIGNHRLADSTIYDYICDNKADDLMASAPEYKKRTERLIEGRRIVITAFHDAWEAVKDKNDLPQKDFALLVKDSKYSGFVFKKRKFEDLTAEKYFNELPCSKQLDYIKDSINDLEDEV